LQRYNNQKTTWPPQGVPCRCVAGITIAWPLQFKEYKKTVQGANTARECCRHKLGEEPVQRVLNWHSGEIKDFMTDRSSGARKK
jgi:hypothetical protein